MTEEKSIEELKSENERLRQAYKYIHASRNNVDEELTEAQKELTSLRSELAEKDKRLQVMLKYESDRDLFIFEQQTKVEKLELELAEKEKAYNDLGVKFDKEMERLHDRDHHNRMLIEAADKVIEAYRSQIYNGTDGKKHLKAIEVYDQLKNTKP